MQDHINQTLAQTIRANALQACANCTNRRELTLLDAAYTAANELVQAQVRAGSLVERYERDLKNITHGLKTIGSLGNNCGVMQGVHELEIVNGKIQALMPVVAKLAEALELL